jgi:hypothetical protein
MTFILYNPDGTIKTFMTYIADVPLAAGETYTETEESFEEVAAKFALSHFGEGCVTVRAHTGDPDIVIDVCATGLQSVSVDVNGDPHIVPLINDHGSITIPTNAPGTFALAPTDKRTFAAAGSGYLVVLVTENPD